VFHALRRATLLLYYMLPGPTGRNPLWDEIGYDGPLAAASAGAGQRALEPVCVGRDSTLECDVVVVGSGAGGATAAAVLAEAGMDVVVLEAGGYHDDADFRGAEHDALLGFYMRAPIASRDESISLLAGRCLGGGTVVNYSTSFRTPDAIRAEWAAQGVPEFTEAEYERSLDAVCERIGVNAEHSTPSRRDELLREGCAKLGWHVAGLSRNVRGCPQDRECGWCGMGCRRGAKQSAAKTWLLDAQTAGARLLVDTRAERISLRAGVADGVEARTSAGHRVTVRARAVVSACGALHTPALLRRSGLSNRNIGRHLRLHPATGVYGEFDERIAPWEGVMQALYSDELGDMAGDGYGVKLETAPLHPHAVIPFAPWRGGREHVELMRSIARSSGIVVLLRDRDGGQVHVGRDGEPVVRYRLSKFDRANLRAGVEGAAAVLEAAGARAVWTAHSRAPRLRAGTDGGRAAFMAACDATGWGAGQCELGSLHIMGSARLGGTPRSSACAPSGRVWEARNVYVCDGSVFPTAPGVNPMVSIEATAHMLARGLAATLA
jgi:long-chain-alcohol oxidase